MCPIPIHEEALFIAPHPSTDSVVHHAPTPSVVVVEEDRCRSRSCSSLGLTPRYVFPSPHRTQNCRNRSRSPSLSPRWTRPRPRNFSPARRTPMINVPLPSPSPMPIAQPGPSPVVLPPSWYAEPPSGVWPTQVPKQPADILTLNYNNNFAYAPAAKTYDEAIDIVLELWPELRDVQRDRIKLLVAGSENLVRVPRMTWSAVLCDVPCYEVVHVQVEQLPPPPEYRGKDKGKGKWGDNNEIGRRSSGLFPSIRRIFSG